MYYNSRPQKDSNTYEIFINRRMILESTLIFLLVYWTRGSECSGYNKNGLLYLQQQQFQHPVQRYHQPAIKNRFHPTTYSKESSEEQTAAANMPKPQTVPQIQYAYQGGDTPQDSPDYPELDVHQGEVLNHVRQQPGSQSAITPRPHPVYQQMGNPPGGSSMPQPPQQPAPQPPSQGISQQVISSPIYHPQEIAYEPNQGYPDHHGYPEHIEFDGYHYSYPVHHHPPPPPPPKRPPPQKSKATESQYAYYYIGRHLWYIPLYFSIYFIAYVGLLVLKSIARHKVLLPHLSEEAAMQRQYRENYALRSIAEGKQKYYMRR